MSRFSLTIILLIISSFSFGQDCKTFNDYGNFNNLDSNYQSAIHIDSTIAVFHKREEEFIVAWKSLLSDLGQHLSNNRFLWNVPTSCFNKVYFNKFGKIEVFLFNFKTGSINKEKERKFTELLKSFTKDYKLKIDSPANKSFSQCGAVKYYDKEKYKD